MGEEFVFNPPAPITAPVAGGGLFPVRRFFCIGRNYANHVREMGGDPSVFEPVFFCKPADALVTDGEAIPYPSATDNLHYEGELVVALGGQGGNPHSIGTKRSRIFGFAAGCDLTRRDLQSAAKQSGAPWDAAKGFDYSAPLGAIRRASECVIDKLMDEQLVTTVNGAVRQNAPLRDMILNVDQIIMALSTLFKLQAGDLIFTGTPDGVGSISPGDTVHVKIGGLPPLQFSVSPKATRS